MSFRTIQLQRLPFRDALILHDRMYPYVTYLPDISEYGFTDYPEIHNNEHVVTENPNLVDLEKLVFLLRAGRFPRPFESNTPAIDLFLKKDHEYEKI